MAMAFEHQYVPVDAIDVASADAGSSSAAIGVEKKSGWRAAKMAVKICVASGLWIATAAFASHAFRWSLTAGTNQQDVVSFNEGSAQNGWTPRSQNKFESERAVTTPEGNKGGNNNYGGMPTIAQFAVAATSGKNYGAFYLNQSHADCQPSTHWLGRRSGPACAARCAQYDYFVHAENGDSNCKCASCSRGVTTDHVWGLAVYKKAHFWLHAHQMKCHSSTSLKGHRSVEECAASCHKYSYFVHLKNGDCKCATKCATCKSKKGMTTDHDSGLAVYKIESYVQGFA